jgi:serine/threonine protein kinase
MGCCFSSEEDYLDYSEFTGTTEEYLLDKDEDTDFTQIDADSFDTQFRRCEQLGIGQSCVVYRVLHKRTNEEYACKVMQKERNCPQHCFCSMHKKVREEVSTLKKMNHKHIYKLLCVFETSSNIYIVSLLC